MICSECCKSFEGRGTVCPECQPTGFNQERITETPQFNSNSQDIYPAGLLGRLTANLFDTFLLGVVVQIVLAPLLIGIFLELINKSIAAFPHSSNMLIVLVIGNIIGIFAVVLILMLISPLYYILFECSGFMATPGKILLGLVVTDLRGNKLIFSKAFLRVIARFCGVIPVLIGLSLPFILPAQIAGKLLMSCFLLGTIISVITYPMVFFTIYKQGLHDLISGCVVQESDKEAPPFGMLAAIAGIIFFIAIFILFGKKVEGNFKNKSKFIELKLDEIEKKNKFISGKKTNESSNNKNNNPPVEKPSEVSKSQALANENKQTFELPDGMHASVNKNIVEFKKVKAAIGVSMKTVSVAFFRDEKSSAADFKVALYFKWPIKDHCDLNDIERYDLIFFDTGKTESFKLPGGMKNFILSRYGNPPAGETVGLFCKKEENAISMTTFFKGSTLHNTFQFDWNLQVNANLNLSE